MDHVISHIIINGPLDLWSLATKGTQELMEIRVQKYIRKEICIIDKLELCSLA